MRRRAIAALVVAAVLVPGPADATPAGSGTTRRLGDSTDVVAAAIELSQGAWDDGAASIVALGRSDLFPDSLAGAALAGTDGPVLFTSGGATASLLPAVRAEIVRVLPAPHGCDGSSEIAILGGTGAVSSSVETELSDLGYCVRRLGGASRVETAVLIAEHLRDRGGDLSEILLSRSDSWPDSATGSAYAAATGHPILVTSPTALDPAVAAFLDAANPSRIVLLGGTGALSEGVKQSAGAYGATVRVAGASRDATATAIAEQLWSSRSPSGVTFVNGFASNGWAYAIAAGVNAGLDGAPEVFVEADAVPSATSAYLDEVDDEFTIVAGPESLISEEVVAAGEASRGMDDPPGAAPLRYRDEVFDDVDHTADISYGPYADDVMDVYEPAGDSVTSRPLLIWIHGGGFTTGSRNAQESFFTDFVRHGFVVASIDYRLIPAPGCNGNLSDACRAGMATALDDAQAAVQHLTAHASTYGIDPTRIAMIGHSAGGITALHAAFASEEEPDVAIRAGISIAGFALISEATSGDAPVLLFHAQDDGTVPYAAATATYDRARAAGLQAFVRSWSTGGHFAYEDHVDQVVDESCSFLWWQLDLQGAAA